MSPAEPPSVSVVLATYNGERFLQEQLDSIAAQTVLPMEVLIGDDGSTDDTIAIAERFRESAPFVVRIQRNPVRLGYAQNFLTTGARASGTVLAFCDQDDRWRPDKLEYALAALHRTGAALFVHGAELIDESGHPFGRFDQHIRRPRTAAPLHSAPWGVLYGFSMVFRRELLAALDAAERGPHTFEHRGTLSHDLWVYFVATSLFPTVLDPVALVGYRQHANNATPHLRGSWFKRFTTSLGLAPHPDLPRHRIAEHRARLLGTLADSTNDRALRLRAKQAERYWREVARFERIRVDLYTNARRLRRIRAWAVLLIQGGYARLTWSLALKDLLAGVLSIRRRPHSA